MKYVSFLISVTIETNGCIERLSEIGGAIENGIRPSDLSSPTVQWSLYGFKKNSPSEWIGDYGTQAYALEIYENLTGLDRPEGIKSDQLHIPLEAPEKHIAIGYASDLAEQIEQMKGMFNDNDGAIETALNSFYEEQDRIYAE